MGWQAQPWGFTQAREHPQGTTVLVLGILSLVVCQVLGPFAWKIGNAALRDMNAQPDVTWSNRGNITAGRILGIVSTVLMLVGIAFFVLWLLFAVAVVSST
jgi:hypothetical protein